MYKSLGELINFIGNFFLMKQEPHIRQGVRLDYQPLFGKGARAPDTSERRKSSLQGVSLKFCKDLMTRSKSKELVEKLVNFVRQRFHLIESARRK